MDSFTSRESREFDDISKTSEHYLDFALLSLDETFKGQPSCNAYFQLVLKSDPDGTSYKSVSTVHFRAMNIQCEHPLIVREFIEHLLGQLSANEPREIFQKVLRKFLEPCQPSIN